jgi:hypothetical protein
MQFDEILKLHEEYEAVPKFFLQPAVQGGVLKLPTNVIKMFPEREVIYEVDNGQILVYENKTKTRSLKIDFNYAIIPIMIIDIKISCENQGYAIDLCKIYDSNNESKNDGDVLIDLFNSLNTKVGKRDLKLMESLIDFIDNPEDSEPVDDSVKEGFKFCYNYYMENIQND